MNQYLYGVDIADELSLSTTASRASFEFDEFPPRFQQDLQGLLYADIAKDRFAQVKRDAYGISHFVDPQIDDRHAQWRAAFQTMTWDVFAAGLAQHYGIPTDGLDLTETIDTAVWMALMERRSRMVGGHLRAWYQPRSAFDQLPVVYLFAVEDPPPGSLADFGKQFPSLRSIRQECQRAHLHFGGWGLHTSLCAEEALAAVFLSHRMKVQLAKPEDVFSGPKNDHLFGRLLKLRNHRLSAGSVWGWASIAEYEPD